jgi:hypothetical protein
VKRSETGSFEHKYRETIAPGFGNHKFCQYRDRMKYDLVFRLFNAAAGLSWLSPIPAKANAIPGEAEQHSVLKANTIGA